MNLLIITQKVDVNDDNLGFFCQWLEKFAKKLDKLYVICLLEGEYHLSENTKVYSLGKEKGFSKLRQFFRLQKFLLKYLPEVDGVFIHMCPIYAVLSFPLVKIFKKKMILWFTHKSVNWKLKLAEKLVDKILTASEESCRVRNRRKIKIVGHGIDIEKFKVQNSKFKIAVQSSKFKILSVGRVAPIKDLETLIRAIDVLVNQKDIKDIELKIIGSAILDSDKQYFKKIRDLVKEKNLENYVKFIGGVSNIKMPEYYQNADLLVNLSRTGSVDKSVLEAMACGCLVLTCNEAFKKILNRQYLFKQKDSSDLADKIINFKRTEKNQKLREIVVNYYNLDNLIIKILNEF